MSKQTHTIIFNAQSIPLAECARLTKIPYATLYRRIKNGTSPDKLLAPPPHRPTRNDIAHTLITAHGKTQTLKKWALELRINYSVLKMRYIRGDRGDHLLRPYLAHSRPTTKTPDSPHNIYLTHQNKTRSLFEWSRALGVGFVTTYTRYMQGERDFNKLFNTHNHHN